MVLFRGLIRISKMNMRDGLPTRKITRAWVKYIKFVTSHEHHLLKKIALTSSYVQITTDFSQLQQGINYHYPPTHARTHAPQGSINVLLCGAFAQVGNLLNLRRRSSILPEASKGLSFLFCSPRIPNSFAVIYLPDVHSISSNSLSTCLRWLTDVIMLCGRWKRKENRQLVH